MKKIVIDARESGTSSGRYVDKLIEYLHQLNPDYKIYLLAKPSRVDFLKSIAPSFQIVESPYKEFTFDEQIGLLKQITNINPDLVHFTFPQQPVLYRGKTVTTIHDLTALRFRNPAKNWLMFTIKQRVFHWVMKRVARKATTVITPTEFVKDDIAKFAHINSRKVTVTYEAADEITGSPEVVPELSTGDAPFILYVGRPQPHKNLPRLIQAFVMLKQTHPDLKLVLAGKFDKAYKQLKSSVDGGNIHDIIFTDFVKDLQLRWLYDKASVYAFPSLSEGFGLPGLEAMVHGAPLVSSNATCLPEVFGDAAEYCDPYDAFAIASAIARVLDSPKRTEELRVLGKKQAQKYSWKRMAEQTLTVYDDALKDAV